MLKETKASCADLLCGRLVKSKDQLLKIAVLFAAATTASGEPVLAQSLEADHELRARTQMFDDWRGARSALAARGILVDLQATQFYQGVVDGSAGSDDWEYGIKGDLYLTFLGERLGLWKGLVVSAHVEGRGGGDVNDNSGLSPANAAMLMPNATETMTLTQLEVLQALSPEFALAGGKINAFDLIDKAAYTGRGVDGFMNASLVLPLGLGATVPHGLLAGGALKLKGKEVQGALMVYDPNECITTTCLKEPFEDAAVVGLWKFFTGIGPESGRGAGFVAFGGTYSGKQYTVFDRNSLVAVPGEGIAFTQSDSSWSIFSVVNQQLWADALDPERAVNFKGMYTFTDGKANPIKWTATAAVEMIGLIPSRRRDVFGVGYFHNELSSGFKDVAGSVLSAIETIETGMLTTVNIEDTDGFEAYYKAQITPWLALTGDVQWITRTLSTSEDKVVTGVRGKVTF